MRVLGAIAAQRGHLFHWVPVALAFGVGGYFVLPMEPSVIGWGAIIALALVLGVLARRLPEAVSPLASILFLMLIGVLLMGMRVQIVDAPVLSYRFYGAVEGRVTAIDRSHADVTRITLDQVWMERQRVAKTPKYVRVSLHGGVAGFDLTPGQKVAVTANLSPPPGPAEPGGFDFRRRAWFDQLGAVGYARSPAMLIAPAGSGASLWVHRLRVNFSRMIRARVPGDEGAFAAAILTGDRAAISKPMLQALRDSNLAHLLAISGLHMGLLTGLVFAGLRYGLALIPPLALRWPARKIAAVTALGAAAFYLMLSGGNVSTQRAFIMVSVMLIAVLADRRALTLRAVALAAVIVLTIAPESLLEPGFQMSFAATTALVAVFGALRRWPEHWPRAPGWLKPVIAVVISSAVAGIATAPFGAAHFNQVAQFGLLANVLSVPLMGAVVMPAALIGLILFPFGLSAPAFEVMRLGIAWILGVAQWVAGLDGATWPVVVPGPAVLPLLSLGALWLILWRGSARWGGIVAVLAAMALWSQASRPALLVSENGALVGVLTEQGRDLNKPRGDGFTAESWLENDGDSATQEQAFARKGWHGGQGIWQAHVGAQPIMHVSGRGWRDLLPVACRQGWVIVGKKVQEPPPDCVLIDQTHLRRTGALAVLPGADGPRVIHARQAGRPWSP